MKWPALVIITLLLLAPGPAEADCTTPAKAAGEIIYNADHRLLQYCDGADWISFPARAPQPGWTSPSQSKVLAADAAAGDEFGMSVGVSGDLAVIGAGADDGGKGSAYIFGRSGGAWSQMQKLTASDAAASDFFGESVAISGDAAIVGSPQDDDKGSTSGSVYIFTESGSAWSQTAKLTASDGAANDQFGYSVAVSGDLAIVGAPYDDSQKGAAYIFTRSGGVWSQTQKLTASDAAASDKFGWSVSISGDTAVIGAYLDDDAGASSGSAYVFTRSGGVWSQAQKLAAADGAETDTFGFSVSVSGDVALIGAWQDDDAGSASGSAYVFTRSGGVWSQTQKLTASDAAAGDNFSYSVSVSGDVAVIGARADGDLGASAGSAYVFTRSGGVWSQTRKITAADGAAADYFGLGASVSGDAAIVGAWQNDAAGANSGAAYFFAPGVGAATACEDPHASTGKIIYNADHHVMQYCNGADWVAMGPKPPSSSIAVTFDGGNDYLSGSVTGSATDFAFSFWIRPHALAADVDQTVFTNNTGHLYVRLLGRSDTDNKYDIEARLLTSTGTSLSYRATNSEPLTAGIWHHVMISGKAGTGASIYVDDVSPTGSGSTGTGTADYYAQPFYIGAASGGSQKLDADLAEFWMDDVYLNPGTAGNRRKFITAALEVEDVGADGSTPTGAVPMIYLKGPASGFHVNLGAGGGFTETGALADASPGPPLPGAGGSPSCSTPSRPEGTMIYNADCAVMQYCDGTAWQPIGKDVGSTPGAFSFTDRANVTLSTLVTSDVVTINGLGCAASVSVTGQGNPQIRVDEHSWTDGTATISNGQTLEVRLTSNAALGVTNTATVTVGSASRDWNVTTFGCTKTVTSSDSSIVPADSQTIAYNLTGGGGGGGSGNGTAGGTVSGSVSVAAGDNLAVYVGGGGGGADGQGSGNGGAGGGSGWYGGGGGGDGSGGQGGAGGGGSTVLLKNGSPVNYASGGKGANGTNGGGGNGGTNAGGAGGSAGSFGDAGGAGALNAGGNGAGNTNGGSGGTGGTATSYAGGGGGYGGGGGAGKVIGESQGNGGSNGANGGGTNGGIGGSNGAGGVSSGRHGGNGGNAVLYYTEAGCPW
jgi:hypothetical protein